MSIAANECPTISATSSAGDPSFPRSPLRYPGGKSRAIAYILPLIPKHEKKLCAPFLGGASVELACTTSMEVSGSDVFEPLVNFWRALLNNQEALVERVEHCYPLSTAAFYRLKNKYFEIPDSLEQAAAFFVLNRASFGGLTLSGGMQRKHPRFNQAAIERLRSFQVSNFSVACMDFRESTANNRESFLYLDPPYKTKYHLYGYKGNAHKGFDHTALAAILAKRERWILSYNDCPEIREMYNGYPMLPVTLSYSIRKRRQATELLILSHDVVIPKECNPHHYYKTTSAAPVLNTLAGQVC